MIPLSALSSRRKSGSRVKPVLSHRFLLVKSCFPRSVLLLKCRYSDGVPAFAGMTIATAGISGKERVPAFAGMTTLRGKKEGGYLA